MKDDFYHPLFPDSPKKKRKSRNRPKNSARVRRMLWKQDPRCHYCKKPLSFEESTLDHKLAKAKGGLNGIFNLVISCKQCNNEKSDKDYKQYIRGKKKRRN